METGKLLVDTVNAKKLFEGRMASNRKKLESVGVLGT